MLRPVLLLAFAAVFTVPALAEDPVQPDLTHLQAALGDIKPDGINTSAIPGLYEIILGPQVLYLSKDGGFAIQGDMIDLTKRANLTEQRRNGLRAKAIEAVGEDNMVTFAPEGQAKYTISVFTDIDCGYCRQFHRQMADYNAAGIKVRYLMYPRAGIDSESYRKAVNVWCAEDRKDAMTRAKQGQDVPGKTCDNPVQKHFALGNELGVRGTPSIILGDGELVPGYVPPARLVQLLNDQPGG
jgi:thiol:disulfide interchange protein DsbC